MRQENLRAYHGDDAIKEKYLSRVRAHRAADELIKGTYWEDGKGCAVGCTVHSDDHRDYETELGIPVQLARIEDGLFEALPNGKAQEWPESFLDAIPVGANLYFPYWQFMQWLLVDPVDGVIKFAKTERTKSAIEGVAKLFGNLLAGERVSEKEWIDARHAAYAAAADAYAADAAADAYADAADAYADDAYAAASTARTNARIRQSEKLLELLRSAPVGDVLAKVA